MRTLIITFSAFMSLTAFASPIHQQFLGGGKGSSFMDDAHQSMKEMCSQMEEMHMTGDLEQDFAMMMIPHHQGAIDMARAYLLEGNDPELRRMAEKMIEEQEKEIQELQKWVMSH